MRFAKKSFLSLITLTLFSGCGKTPKEVIPPTQQVIALREDGCTGPEELANHLLVGRGDFIEINRFIKACVEHGYLPKETASLSGFSPPEALTCPGLERDVMVQNFLLAKKEDIALAITSLMTCQENVIEEQEREPERSA